MGTRYGNRGSWYYGPRREGPGRTERDRDLGASDYDHARTDARGERERNNRREASRMKPEAVDELGVLRLSDVDMHVRTNAQQHHTHYFYCTKGNNPKAVLRRGQEFVITATFNRAFDRHKDDLFFEFEADPKSTAKELSTIFQLHEHGSDVYKRDDAWGARLVESEEGGRRMKMAVYIPSKCVVGEWEVSLKTLLAERPNEEFVYVIPTDVIILFNPWSAVDLVHFSEKTYSRDQGSGLEEYVLNPAGTVYRGTSNYPISESWTYGQFQKGVLEICLSLLRKAFAFKMTPHMGNPITVARALSRIVNNQDDMGVLVGRWDNNYGDGTAPLAWRSSVPILRQFAASDRPVKYGQCWVFSHLLTTVCRALGLPCRSVTTYDSAHDTDKTCTIDYYFNADGDKLSDMTTDSVWNYHVWNEVWIQRPDLHMPGNVYSGWHTIDATPQERSQGLFQCGPCPVEAVKRGDTTVGFDTPFVFSEVNADVYHWQVDPSAGTRELTAVKKSNVGSKVVTKPATGEGHEKGRKTDITSNYKFPEGSSQEREAVRRAIRGINKPQPREPDRNMTYKDLEVKLEENYEPVLGQDLILTARVKNPSRQERLVEVIFSVRTCKYWGGTDQGAELGKARFKPTLIKPGHTEDFEVLVSPDLYLQRCDDEMCIYGYVKAQDTTTGKSYSDQHAFELEPPQLDVQVPRRARSGEVVTATVTFTNPLSTPLTKGYWLIDNDRDLELGLQDRGRFTPYKTISYLSVGEIGPKTTETLRLQVVGQIEPDETGHVETMDLAFVCSELANGVKGTIAITLTA